MSRIRILLASVALVAGTTTWSVPAHAVCIPNNFAANWLQQQENAGGHTIALHVGQTDLQLAARLQNDGLNAVGSFPNSVATAQGTITAGLAANRNTINNWAAHANNNARRAYNYVTAPPATIGRVATWDNNVPPAPVVGNTCTFRAVIKATGGGNCYLLTAFPTPPGGAACP